MLGKYILVFLVSMLPVAELRLSVPMAVQMGLPYVPALVVCVIGNIVPVPFIYYFARRFLTWGAEKKYLGPVCRFCLTRGHRAGEKVAAKTGRYGLLIGLMLFVGIPLPGTGAWTGAMAASFLDIGVRTTFAAVSLGVIIAGIIMYLASIGVFYVIGI